jgi:E3 ubiquitin-protein ligase ZSWIM2
MSRASAYVNKPDEQTLGRIAELMDGGRRMLLVQTVGPTVRVVKEDGSGRKYKVVIGSKQMCSHCRYSEGLCVHILFVMLKVLRIPRDNPVVWQQSLTDNEIDNVLSVML